MAIAHVARHTRQKHAGKHAGKHAHIPSEIFLMQEAVFCRQFDIPDARDRDAHRGIGIGDGQNSGELQILRAAVIEIDAGLAARSIARIGA